jgi:hypothetical protein
MIAGFICRPGFPCFFLRRVHFDRKQYENADENIIQRAHFIGFLRRTFKNKEKQVLLTPEADFDFI